MKNSNKSKKKNASARKPSASPKKANAKRDTLPNGKANTASSHQKNAKAATKITPVCELKIIETPMVGNEITTLKPWKPKKRRAWELDFLRGLAILLVAMDHTFFDMSAVFGEVWAANPVLSEWSLFASSYLSGSLREFWKPFFLFVFFFVSGISSGFSRNNLFRSFKLVGAALFINFATYILDFHLGMPDTFIKFGVIQCFSVIVLVYALIELIVRAATFKSKKLYKWLISAVCLAVGIAVLIVNERYNVGVMDFENYNRYADVAWDSPLAAVFFYIEKSWALPSADYFPLFPYLGYFMLGAGLTNILYPNKKSLLPFLDGYQRLPVSGKRVNVGLWHKIFTIPGRYSLIIYISWQVIAIGILGAVTLIVFGELPFF